MHEHGKPYDRYCDACWEQAQAKANLYDAMEVPEGGRVKVPEEPLPPGVLSMRDQFALEAEISIDWDEVDPAWVEELLGMEEDTYEDLEPVDREVANREAEAKLRYIFADAMMKVRKEGGK